MISRLIALVSVALHGQITSTYQQCPVHSSDIHWNENVFQ